MLVGAVDSGGRATNLILGGAVDHSPHQWTLLGSSLGSGPPPVEWTMLGSSLGSVITPVEWTILGLPEIWITASGMDNIGGYLGCGSPPVEWTILGLPGMWITPSGMDNIGGFLRSGSPPVEWTILGLPGMWITLSGMDNIGGGCNARLWPRFFDEFCCCYCWSAASCGVYIAHTTTSTHWVSIVLVICLTSTASISQCLMLLCWQSCHILVIWGRKKLLLFFYE